jgi:hypothetical protein
MKKKFRYLVCFLTVTVVMLTNSCKNDDNNPLPAQNQPPGVPINPYPINNSSTGYTTDLAWNKCTDPDGDPIKYDIYYGTTNPPLLFASNLTTNYYDPDTPDVNLKYYWRVVAKDNHNNTTSSQIWSYSTYFVLRASQYLQVFVCDKAGKYLGGDEVYLYETKEYRANDTNLTNYSFKAATDSTNPSSNGALFDKVNYPKYYIYCRRNMGGGNFLTGTNEKFIIFSDSKLLPTKVTVVVQ